MDKMQKAWVLNPVVYIIVIFFLGLIAHAQKKRSDGMLHDISWKQSQEILCLNGNRAWHWTILRQCNPVHTRFYCLLRCNLTLPPSPTITNFSQMVFLLAFYQMKFCIPFLHPPPPTIHATHPTQVILFDLISPILSPEVNKLWTLSSRDFLLNHIVFSKLYILALIYYHYYIFMYLIVHYGRFSDHLKYCRLLHLDNLTGDIIYPWLFT